MKSKVENRLYESQTWTLSYLTLLSYWPPNREPYQGLKGGKIMRLPSPPQHGCRLHGRNTTDSMYGRKEYTHTLAVPG